MPRKKDAANVTLAEHVARIGKLGGKARAENLTPEQLSEIGRKAGLKGGRARAKKLSPNQRKEIARKAALARWNKE